MTNYANFKDIDRTIRAALAPPLVTREERAARRRDRNRENALAALASGSVQVVVNGGTRTRKLSPARTVYMVVQALACGATTDQINEAAPLLDGRFPWSLAKEQILASAGDWKGTVALLLGLEADQEKEASESKAKVKPRGKRAA